MEITKTFSLTRRPEAGTPVTYDYNRRYGWENIITVGEITKVSYEGNWMYKVTINLDEAKLGNIYPYFLTEEEKSNFTFYITEPEILLPEYQEEVELMG